jgi:hypothetical protein
VSPIYPSSPFYWQYVPSVEDTVLGVVVDIKPDVSIHLRSKLCQSALPPFCSIYPNWPWIQIKKVSI